MNIKLRTKKDCTLCVTMTNVLNIAKLFFDFELELVEDEERSPVTEFWKGDTKVSEFEGLPAIDVEELQIPVALLFVFQGAIDCYKHIGKEDEIPEVYGAAKKINDMLIRAKNLDPKEYQEMKEIDIFSMKKYGMPYKELCKDRKIIIKQLFKLNKEEQNDS